MGGLGGSLHGGLGGWIGLGGSLESPISGGGEGLVGFGGSFGCQGRGTRLGPEAK